jgi:hypothetical protein
MVIIYSRRLQKISNFEILIFFSDISKRVNEYLTSMDNEADIFLPVQGQKRGTIKMNKKKTQSHCLQQ